MDKIVIIKEIKSVDFYDGASSIKNVATKNEYWLCSSNEEEYKRAYISFFDKNNQEVKIRLFENASDIGYKYLSEFQPPQFGFFEDDLLSMANMFHFEVKENAARILSGFHAGHQLSLIIKKTERKNYFLIYSVTGGRGPEGIYIFGVYETLLNAGFKNKYQMI